MALVEIKVGGGSLDLLERDQSKFYITKLAHDLRDIQTRNASFSKSINLPRTANNVDLLAINMIEFVRDLDSFYTFMDCEVLVSGTPTESNSRLVVLSQSTTGKTIKIQVFGGILDLFEALPETGLSTLDFANDSFDWNLTNLAPYFNTTEGLLIARSCWHLNQDYDNAIIDGMGGIALENTDINFSGAYYHILSLFKKILDPLPGFNFDYSDLDQTNVADLLLMFPTKRLFENFNASEAAQGIREANLTLPNLLPSEGAINLDFPILKVDDPVGFWDPVNFYYTVGVTGFYTIRVHMEAKVITSGNYTGAFGDWAIFVGGTGEDSRQIFVKAVYKTLNIGDYETSIYLNAGEVVRVLFQTRGNISGGAVLEYTNSSFELQGGGNITSKYVNLGDYAPDISQKDFVKSVLELFHLIPQYKDGVVSFKLWDKVISGPWLDLSKYVVEDRPQSFQGFISSYGQNNLMQYTADKDVLQATQSGSTFSFPQQYDALPVSAVKIQSKFSPSDQAKAAEYVDLTAPIFPFEYTKVTATNLITTVGSIFFTTSGPHSLKVGDQIYARNAANNGYQPRQNVVAIDGDTGGAVSANWTESTQFPYEFLRYKSQDIGLRIAERTTAVNRTIYDGGENVFTLQNGAAFNARLTWGDLAANYYPIYTAMMQKPTVESIWLRIPPVVFSAIDPLQAVYIKDRVYYLNKLEQYTATNFTRAELVEFKQQGEVQQTAYYTVRPTPLIFGLMEEAETKALVTKVSNVGDVSINFSVSAITGVNAGAFVFTSDVSPFTLQAGEFKFINVEATMDAGFADLEAAFTVISAEPTNFDVVVPLEASPNVVINYFADPNPMYWGDIPSGAQNQDFEGLVFNQSEIPITFQLGIVSGPQAANFQRVAPTPAGQFTLNPGETQALKYRFDANGPLAINTAFVALIPISPALPEYQIELRANVTP